jgi:DNA repair photolyase
MLININDIFSTQENERKRSMDIIYEPQGAAREYSNLALNIYKGCEHACKYCFGPSALNTKRELYNSDANPKKSILDRIRKDTQYLAKNNINDEILLSFIGDPYQPAETKYHLTRKTLEILIEYNRPFTVLTKGGTRAVNDFDLFASYPKSRFGTSLSFTNQQDADEWEPGAASIHDRIEAIMNAHTQGIPTWVSLEPVIYPKQAIKIIKTLYPYVNHWKVGKINHMKQVEKKVDWIQFREEVRELLDLLDADYYLKKCLTELK